MPTVFGYTTGGLAAGVMLWWLHTTRGIQDHDEWLVAGVAVLGALLPYRFHKAFWIWLLWATGWVFKDEAGA